MPGSRRNAAAPVASPPLPHFMVDTRPCPFYLEPPTMPMRAPSIRGFAATQGEGWVLGGQKSPHPEQAPLGSARDRLRAVSRSQIL